MAMYVGSRAGRLRGELVGKIFGGSATGNRRRKFTFILPAWQIANVIHEPSAEMRKVFAHLNRISQIYGYDPAGLFSVWSPTAAPL